MENLSLKFTRTDLPQFMNLLTEIVRVTEWTREEYFHRLNLSSLGKKLFVKWYTLLHSRPNSKTISLRVNVNEFESLKVAYSRNKDHFSNGNFDYYNIILSEAYAQMDRQVVNLYSSKNFLP